MENKSTLKIEKEYKFLVKDANMLKKIIPISEVNIIQGYLTGPDDSSDIRLRGINNGEFLITVKEGGGFSRFENEVEINKDQFMKLWKNVNGRIIEKTRYKFFLTLGKKDFLAEVDVYGGKHKGLVIMEIEVGENETLEDVKMPEWIVENVTGDKGYSNRNLACIGVPD